MEATSKNEKIARTIINTLAENKCTVDDASQILRFVNSSIGRTTTVQKVDDRLFNEFN